MFTKVTMLPLDLAKKRLEVSDGHSDSIKGLGVHVWVCVLGWGWGAD